jgi:hypothetical protein
LIDRDPARFTVSRLQEWKQWAEDTAARELSAGSRYRPIAASEILQELTVAEVVAIKALEDEFGCHIETEVHVPAGDGFLRLHGAVVRGEDLVAIDIRQNHGNGIAYFQVEYLLELCAKFQFPRFRKCVIYIAVVADGPPDTDEPVRKQLEALIERHGLECYIRMFRLNELRAKYSV